MCPIFKDQKGCPIEDGVELFRDLTEDKNK